MSSDFTSIISSVKTKSDQTQLLRELEMLERSLYKLGDQNFDNVIKTGVNDKLAEAISEELHKIEDTPNITKKQDLILSFKSRVMSLNIIKITLPIEPSEHMITQLYTYLTQISGPENILDIEIDKTILGGAKITNQGKYIDCTLNNKWEDIWKDIKI